MASKITVRGMDEALRELDDIAGRIENMQPVMEVIAADIKEFVDDRFETSTDPAGKSWKPLSPKTTARRRQRSSKPLVDTGVLRNSVNARPGQRSVEIGTNVPYAAPHQFGTARIPKRSFLPVRAEGGRYALELVGPAGEEWARFRDMIAEYIKTGRIEG